jgi:hypothetical protein
LTEKYQNKSSNIEALLLQQTHTFLSTLIILPDTDVLGFLKCHTLFQTFIAEKP